MRNAPWTLTIVLAAVVALTIPAAAQEGSAAEPARRELGTAEASLGPAHLEARFFAVDGEPRIEVTVRNDTERPLWWRGAGIGCTSNSFLVVPHDTEGRPLSRFDGIITGCTMEEDAPPTPEQLETWRMDPGDARTRLLRPFRSEIGEGRDPLPDLDRWAWWRHFTLPRTDPPPGTMQFEQPSVLFAWSRATGPRVIVEGKMPFWSEHFDPFDATPGHTGTEAIPFRLGPLHGMATLREERGLPVVELTLTNPTDRGIGWSTRSHSGEVIHVLDDLRFDASDPRSGEEAEWQGGVRATSPDPRLDVHLWAPGTRRTLTLRPFDGMRRQGQPLRRAEPPLDLERWHYRRGSIWPTAATDGVAGAVRDPAALHLYWDERHGLDVALQRDGNTSEWQPFQGFAAHREFEAALLGPLRCILETYHWGRSVAFDLENPGKVLAYANVACFEDSDAHWVSFGGRPTGDDPAAITVRRDGEPFGGDMRFYDALPPGEDEELKLNLGDFAERRFEQPAWDWAQEPFEVYVPIGLPQHRAPRHTRDYALAWLHVRRDDAGRVDATIRASLPD